MTPTTRTMSGAEPAGGTDVAAPAGTGDAAEPVGETDADELVGAGEAADPAGAIGADVAVGAGALMRASPKLSPAEMADTPERPAGTFV
jgi:hypothetical protein